MGIFHGQLILLSQRMVMMINIKIGDRRKKFQLTFYGKINFLLGASGSNKSYFTELCGDYSNGVHTVSGEFYLDSEKISRERIIVFDNRNDLNDYESVLLGKKNCIIIVYEFCKLYTKSNFGELIKRSENYFIFISRKIYGSLDMNVKSVYEFDINKNLYKSKLVYSE